tara:strand:+ start:4876 stop:5427 length:552 start_codon:yes stop_codon:yes gene_type:complete
MKRNSVETIMGAVVILLAVGFVYFFQKTTDIGKVGGYEIQAKFSKIDGLSRGTPVRISGVDVGKVTDFELDSESYMAIVTMNIQDGIEIPFDTAAVISSESLLGGKYLSLEPGADPEMLAEGDMIEYTQSTPGLEALLGQAIYSFSKGDDSGEEKSSDVTPDVEASEMPVSLENSDNQTDMEN